MSFVFDKGLLSDVFRIAIYGNSFRHSWKKGATMTFKGNKIYFVNEARTAVMIYVSDGAQFPHVSIDVATFPDKLVPVKLVLLPTQYRLEFGEGGYLKRNTFPFAEDKSELIEKVFNDEFSLDNNFEFSAEILETLTKDVDLVKIEVTKENFKMTQTPPDAVGSSENVWDFGSSSKGTMMKFMKQDLPDVHASVIVATDELKSLQILSGLLTLAIRDDKSRLCGKADMQVGELIFMLSPFAFSYKKEGE